MKYNNFNLKFKSGYVFLGKSQVMIFPLNYFISLFHILISNYSNTELNLLLEKTVEKDSKFIFDQISELKITNKNKICYFLNFLNSLGIGNIDLKFIRTNKILFSMNKIYLSKVYENIFKEKPKYYLENLILKYLETFLNFLYNKVIFSKLIVKSNSLYFEFIISNVKTEANLKNLNYPLVNKEKSILFTKLLKNGKLNISNGIFKVMEAFAVSIPYFFYISLIENLNDLSFKKWNNLNQIQGMASVEMHKKMFGISDMEVFNSVVNFSDVSGFGKIFIPNNNPEFLQIENNFQSYLPYFSKDTLDRFNLNIIMVCFGVYEFSFNLNANLLISDFGKANYKKINNNLRDLSIQEQSFSNYLGTKVLISNFL